jgi:hypothetical protein
MFYKEGCWQGFNLLSVFQGVYLPITQNSVGMWGMDVRYAFGAWVRGMHVGMGAFGACMWDMHVGHRCIFAQCCTTKYKGNMFIL